MPTYLPTSTRGNVTTGLLGVLLLLRFPLLFAAEMGWVDQSLALGLYLCGTYLCTGVLLCLNLDRLEQFCISIPALVIFLGAPLLWGLASAGSDPTVILRIIIAVTVGVYLMANRKSLSVVRQSAGQVVKNLALTVVATAVGVVTLLAISGYVGPLGSGGQAVDASWLVESLCFQLGFAAVSEEPLFRGFLWGYLRRWGLSTTWTVVVQAAIFWVGHLYYLDTGLNFWLCLPLASLLLGFVVARTRSIAYSMTVHTLLNSLLDMFRHMVRLF